jgi:NAD(P)-dependent dehydrogenase (short-subunit alcohol dehydrogenase family)
MNAVVISGVSSGIGNGAARELSARGYKVFGTVRDAALGERLRQELGGSFTPLCLDVTDRQAVEDAAAKVRAELGNTDLLGLVNNAGIALPGPWTSISPDLLRQHFEVNVIGALHMVQAFLPLLRGSGQASAGRIVNISSIAGRLAYPFMGPYAASKHALEALSDSLRRELMIYGVDVIVIQPGSIDTPILEKARHIRTAYAQTDYDSTLRTIDLQETRRTALPVSAVTCKILEALTARHPKARYVIPDQRLRLWLLPRLLPDRWLDRVIDHMLGFQAIRDRLRSSKGRA